MVNRPKNIGTFAEVSVLNVLHDYYPKAHREVQHGALDEGDIVDCGDFIFEVKGGKQCQQIGDGKLAKWMGEAELEARRHKVSYGILVCQRAGYGRPNAHRWWTYVDLGVLAKLTGGYHHAGEYAPVRLELGVFLNMLADHGHTPLEYESPTVIEVAPYAPAV